MTWTSDYWRNQTISGLEDKLYEYKSLHITYCSDAISKCLEIFNDYYSTSQKDFNEYTAYRKLYFDLIHQQIQIIEEQYLKWSKEN